MFLKDPVEKVTDKVLLDNCPDCGNKLSSAREGRGRRGMYCSECRILWFNE